MEPLSSSQACSSPSPLAEKRHLLRVLTEYLIRYHTARLHRTLGQLSPAHGHIRPPQIDLAGHRIRASKSSTASSTRPRSLPDSPALLREAAAHSLIRVFKPHKVLRQQFAPR
jgi:hypothetical protein